MVKEKTKLNIESSLNGLSWLKLRVTRATPPATTDFFFYSGAHDDCMYKILKQWNETSETKSTKLWSENRY